MNYHSLKLAVTQAAIVLVSILGIIGTANAINTTNLVGKTEGAFSVSPSGAATYSVSIRVAPGPGGLQPQLSLNYNSQSGNGPVGMGWSVGGQSIITRCAKNYAQDGQIRGVKNDDGDKLCMDGQRIVMVSDTTYGMAGSEYRTEKDSFVKITASGSNTAADGLATTFKVQTKDGLTMTYGGTTNSRVKAHGKEVITIWALSQIKDNVNNEINFEYYNLNDGEYYFKGATYGDATASGAQRSILFEYEDRKDPSKGYLNGSIVKVTKRLFNIESKVAGTLVARYKLEYDTEPVAVAARSRLKKVTECGEDDQGGEVCLNPIEFQWQSTEPDFGERISSGSCGNNTGNSGCDDDDNYYTIQYPDLNGDGISDMCYRADTGIRCRIGTKEGIWGPEVGTGYCSNYTNSYGCANGYSTSGNIHYTDVNGDGRQDLFFRGKDGIHVFRWNEDDSGFTEYGSSTLCSNDAIQYEQYSDDDGYPYARAIAGGCYYSVSDISLSGAIDDYEVQFTISRNANPQFKLSTPDINGDGLADLCYLSRHDGVVCHLNTGFGGTSVWGETQNTTISTGYCSETDGSCQGVYILFSGASVLEKSVNYVDFNADGMSDIAIHEKNGIKTYLSTGNGFVLHTTTSICANASGANNCSDKDNYNTIQYPDINGDGLPDICYRSDNGVMCHHNRGSHDQKNWGDQIATGICSNATCGEKYRSTVQFSDLNADGKADLIYTPSGGIKTHISTGDAFEVKANSYNDICKWGSGAGTGLYGECDDSNNLYTITTADVNGDGKSDLVYRGDQGIQAWVQDFNHTSIKGVTNGNGHQVDITYLPLTNDTVYKHTFAGHVEENLLNDNCWYPVRCGTSPMSVVSSTTQGNGIGGTSSHNYHYYDSRAHLLGRGWLGFGYTDVQNQESNLLVRTRYDNKTRININEGTLPHLLSSFSPSILNETYPYSGIAIEVTTGKLLGGSTWQNQSKTTITPTHNIPVTHDSGDKTYSVYIGESIERKYETDGSEITVKKTTIPVGGVDNYGNVKQQMVAVGTRLNDPNAFITTTVSQYNQEDVSNWHLGRVTSTEVTASVVDPLTSQRKSEIRLSEYEYYASGTHKGMLWKTHEEPNNPELQLTTIYEYDQWGNKKRVEVSGSTIATRDSSDTRTYTSPLEYEVVSEDALGFTETKVFDSRFGVAKSLVGPNQLPTSWKYDAFGRKTEEHRADGTSTKWSYSYCQTGDNCPTHGLYKVTTNHYDAVGGTLKAPTTVYMDALDRELRTKTIGYNNTVVLKDTQYDEQGRLLRQSRAYFAGSNPSHWTTYRYDEYDRIKTVDNPDGSTVTNEYNGLETIIIRERRGENGYTAVTAKQINNLQGKVAETIDAIGSGGGSPTGSRTLFSYHPFGELEQVMPQDNGGASTSMTYDARGRKLTMDDVDMGHWEYQHDALGNLLWQKDAKGQVTSIEYDLLNRMTKRTDQKATPSNAADDDTTTWTYHGIGAAQGSRGKLDTVTSKTNNGAQTVFFEKANYDTLGRVTNTQTTYDNITEPYTVSNTYAANSSRVDYVLYPKSGTGASAVRYKKLNRYDANGYLEIIRGGADNLADNQLTQLWQAIYTNADGKITWEELGNGITTLRGFDKATGAISSINSGKTSSDSSIQDLDYGFDSLGNLEWRQDHNQKNLSGTYGVKETFLYDSLNRLTTVTRDGLTTQAYQYDSLGNITFNSRYGNYTYGENGAGIHAVTSVTRHASGSVSPGDTNADKSINSLDTVLLANQIVGNSGTVPNGNPDCNIDGQMPELDDTACIPTKFTSGSNETFQYDANGSMVKKFSDGVLERELTYTSFNKPETITKGTTTLTFAYGPSRSRYMQTIQNGATTDTLHYIGKLFEREKKADGSFEYKNYVFAGSRMIAIDTRTSTTTSATLHYAHRDHLGSIDVLTDVNADVVERRSYAPFGERRADAQWNDGLNSLINSTITHHGYTEHELLADVGIIHMNGRVYDPQLGRFLSADPHVQFPHDAQSYNRYSYVMNNPLSATDPSGYFLSKLMRGVHGFMDRYHRVIVGVAIMVYAPGSGVGESMIAGFASSFIMSGGDMNAAVIGAITAGAFNAVGTEFTNPGIGKTLAHGVVGGGASLAQGGSFKSGFYAAGFTQGMSWADSSSSSFNLFVKGATAQNTFVASILGGTASVIGGGKFGNGAVTGAFSRMFNDEAGNHQKNSVSINGDTMEAKLGLVKTTVDKDGKTSLTVDVELASYYVDSDGNKSVTVNRFTVSTFKGGRTSMELDIGVRANLSFNNKNSASFSISSPSSIEFGQYKIDLPSYFERTLVGPYDFNPNPLSHARGGLLKPYFDRVANPTAGCQSC